jgi:hypothetical protein
MAIAERDDFDFDFDFDFGLRPRRGAAQGEGSEPRVLPGSEFRARFARVADSALRPQSEVEVEVEVESVVIPH